MKIFKFYFILFLLLISFFMVYVPHTSALSTLYQGQSTCTSTDLDNWDWVGGLKSTVGGGYTGLNIANDSWVIYKLNAGQYASFINGSGYSIPSQDRNVYRMIHGTSANTMNLKYNNGSGIANIYYSGVIDASIFISSESVNLNPSYAYYNASTGQSSYANYKGQYVNPGVTLSSGVASFDLGINGLNSSCVVAMHNISYDSSFTNNFLPYTPNQTYSAKGTTGCAWNDISCQISRVSTDLANAFVPDPTSLANNWSNFSTFMTNKLGFFVYPLTFFTGVYNQFATPSTSCSITSCTIASTTFMSAPFSIDLSTFPRKFPTIWAVIDPIMIALTVWALMVAIYHKYLKIVSKG